MWRTNGRFLRRARAGATTLELAFTLPMFLTLTVGSIEFGRAFMVQQMVTNAAREGARHGVVAGTTADQVKTKVIDYLAAGRIQVFPDDITVTPATLSSATKSGQQVQVHIRVPYGNVTWMPVPWFLGQATLVSETTMRHE
jgi:Flp pilus assembly protein TadG